MSHCFLSALLALFLTARISGQEARAGSFVMNDSLVSELFLNRDDRGLPQAYESIIRTPICETGKCYVVELEMHWDLCGDFLAYDTLAGKALTKLDHKPFAPDDYRELARILGNRASILASYEQEELVGQTRKSAVDGFTGATIAEVKQSVIGGAVYSCHTLWHIVHGAAADSIRSYTRALLDSALVAHMFASPRPGYRAYLLANLSDEQFVDFLPMVLGSMSSGEAYYPRQVVEALPLYVLGDERAQAFFVHHFDQMNYYTQVSLLERMPAFAISPEFRGVLEASLDERNSYRNELIRKQLRY